MKRGWSEMRDYMKNLENNEKLRLLTRKEVANLLNIHENSVSMLSDVGVLNPIKLGKGYMYTQSDLTRFETDYLGFDLSNKFEAIKSKNIVSLRKENKNNE